MKCEIPEVGRCCFCLPLRIGLLVWGYIKLVIDIILLCLAIAIVKDDYERVHFKENMIYFIIYLILAVLIMLDIIFHVIFAVSAHQKDYKKMEWFYKFSIFIFGIYVLGFIQSIAFVFSSHSHDGLGAIFELFFGFTAAVICCVCIMSQVYVIILIRSEVLKLEKHSNLEFVNHSAEANYMKSI